jgi:hypothetical protein
MPDGGLVATAGFVRVSEAGLTPPVHNPPAVHAKKMKSHVWTQRTVLRLAVAHPVSQANNHTDYAPPSVVGPSHLHKKCHTIINLLPGLGRLSPGDSALRAPRNGSCVRRERWARRNLRAGARGGLGCRRSSAHFGPIPLPPKEPAVKMLTFMSEAAVHRLRW